MLESRGGIQMENHVASVMAWQGPDDLHRVVWQGQPCNEGYVVFEAAPGMACFATRKQHVPNF